jgi:hypothetical protein
MATPVFHVLVLVAFDSNHTNHLPKDAPMADKLAMIPLSEIQTIRVRCKTCHGAMEWPRPKFVAKHPHKGPVTNAPADTCPFCSAEWISAEANKGGNNALRDLAVFLTSIQTAHVEIELAIQCTGQDALSIHSTDQLAKPRA